LLFKEHCVSRVTDPRQMLGVIRDAVENVKVGVIRHLYFPGCLEMTGVLTAAYKKPLTILNELTGQT
jgi:hypothetical protein